MASHRHKAELVVVQHVPRVRGIDFQDFPHVFVEILYHLAAGSLASLGDFLLQLFLQNVERGLYFRLGAAFLEDVVNLALERLAVLVHNPQHVVGRAEQPLEKAELLRKQLVHADIGGVPRIAEVDDNDIELLPVAVATSDALFDALRVPGQIIVHDH